MTKQIAKLKAEIERLKRENDLKTGWISLMSHDLKESFGSLLWIVDAVETQTISKDAFFEMLPQIKQDTKKNLQTLTDSEKWLKTQLEGFKVQRCYEFAYELFCNLKKDNEKLLNGKKIDFQFHGDMNLQFETDRFLILFILNKVLNNAIKFSNQGQVIHFKTFEEDDTVSLSLVDFGMGMNQKTLDSLFCFPSQVFQGTGGEVGAGLSLKIVKKFVSLLQGRIEIVSTENQETTVSIFLPNPKIDI